MFEVLRDRAVAFPVRKGPGPAPPQLCGPGQLCENMCTMLDLREASAGAPSYGELYL